MSATIVPQPISMLTLYYIGTNMGQIAADISYADDGALTITTKRKVKGLEIIRLPRRIESAQELIEALTR
jgi:hypothetical protein